MSKEFYQLPKEFGDLPLEIYEYAQLDEEGKKRKKAEAQEKKKKKNARLLKLLSGALAATSVTTFSVTKEPSQAYIAVQESEEATEENAEENAEEITEEATEEYGGDNDGLK